MDALHLRTKLVRRCSVPVGTSLFVRKFPDAEDQEASGFRISFVMDGGVGGCPAARVACSRDHVSCRTI